VTTNEARLELQRLVSRFAHIDLHEVHHRAFDQIDVDTVRLIAKENTRKADAIVSLMGELAAHRDSTHTLFATADPAVILAFTYRYLLMLRYLASAPPDACLFFSSESKRLLEQTLIDMFRNVEETVYNEIVTLHKDAKPKQHPMHSQDKHPPST
jgi:hypothetical protein